MFKKPTPKIRYLLIAVLITANACSRNTPVDETEIKKEASNTFTSYVNHINAEGLEGAETYFASDERFYWVEDGQVQYPNWDSLAAGIRQFHPQVDSVSIQVFETRVDVINQNYATLFAQYKEDIALKSGYAFTLDGAMTIMMTRKDNGWKFLNGHSSIKKPRGR